MAHFSPAELRAIQERAVRAQPIDHTEYAGGWRLGRAASGSWWHGSVIPHGETDDLRAQVEHAEATYAAWERRLSFQISPGLCPDGLDDLLAARGYRRVGPVLLQCAATAEVVSSLPAVPLETHLDDGPTDAWCSVLSRVHGHAESAADRADLEGLGLPAAYTTASSGGRTIGVARAVADTGWTGVFAMAVLPEARGRGAGRALVRALAEWAQVQGTPNMYLQVESGNEPASALYAKAGFTEALAYHYRSKP